MCKQLRHFSAGRSHGAARWGEGEHVPLAGEATGHLPGRNPGLTGGLEPWFSLAPHKNFLLSPNTPVLWVHAAFAPETPLPRDLPGHLAGTRLQPYSYRLPPSCFRPALRSPCFTRPSLPTCLKPQHPSQPSSVIALPFLPTRGCHLQQAGMTLSSYS